MRHDERLRAIARRLRELRPAPKWRVVYQDGEAYFADAAMQVPAEPPRPGEPVVVIDYETLARPVAISNVWRGDKETETMSQEC